MRFLFFFFFYLFFVFLLILSAAPASCQNRPECLGAEEGYGDAICVVQTADWSELRCENLLAGNCALYEVSEITDNFFLLLLYALASASLVLIAGLMSGLTIGLMSLDLVQLQVLENCGTETERSYAKKIIPVVRRHHLLLVTLLVSNAAAMEALPVLLDRMMSPALAIVLSVTFVLLFGEIIPQALCVRWGLAIGAYTAPFVRLLMIVLWPLAYPISKLLDWVFGADHTTFFRRSELKELVRQHEIASQLSHDESVVIQGALAMIEKTAKDSMTPLDQVFMMELDDVYDANMLRRIVAAGHSRIPVYEHDRALIRGIVLVKRLIGVDVSANLPVRQLPMLVLPSVYSHTSLYELLNIFQTGASHMAVVNEPQSEQPLGIITLEDVIEELIQEEIIDETDPVSKIQLASMFSRISVDLQHAVVRQSLDTNAVRRSIERPRAYRRHSAERERVSLQMPSSSAAPSGTPSVTLEVPSAENRKM